MSEPGEPRREGSETIAEARRRIAQALAAVGIDDAGQEARWLLEAALGVTAAELLSRSDEQVAAGSAMRVASFLQRRLQHEPLSRIVGSRAFYGRSFKVTPATLDPRPDTETIIDAALEMLADARDAPLRILDIGTGTGAIVLTLLAEFVHARAVATDISGAALAVARQNAESLGLSSRVAFLETDLAAGVDGPFDLVVCNPPYIVRDDIDGLAPGVRQFDPRIALDGGVDGLDVYRRLAAELPKLVPSGTILLEVGFNQAETVAGMFEAALARSKASAETRFYTDVAGIRRVVAARARSAG